VIKLTVTVILARCKSLLKSQWTMSYSVEDSTKKIISHRVLVAAMSNPPTGWRRSRGLPRETWL